MASRTATAESNKRPRSPAGDFAQVASKLPKTQANHLQINYLARRYPDNLPLVSADDTLPAILRLVGDYDGVLHRHESIAGNLGACPLGPILVKRFERLFDGQPKVLKSHQHHHHNNDGSNGKDGAVPAVTWLDVVEFAKNKPEQFNLEKSRNGLRVCQIYLKQCRVEISEEDYVLIASGMPQKMIPPQPISEDEEKELGALEILEKNLNHIIQLADQVGARARQLNHRLKNRKNAIVSRRESEASLASQQPQAHSHRATSPFKDGNTNGHSGPANASGLHSPQSGFVAVNSRADSHDEHVVSGSHFTFSNPNTDNITIINGTSIKGASPSTRAELMKKFFTTADNRSRGATGAAPAPSAGMGAGTGAGAAGGAGGGYPEEDDSSSTTGRPTSRRPRESDAGEYGPYAGPPVAIPSTPSALLPQPKSASSYDRDDGGPFKIEMVSRMEDLQRGDRILPPCDRCRRLHMDCLKNLTACMGCTKKHAKCSWKEVTLEELRETYPTISRRQKITRSLSEMSGPETSTTNHHPHDEPEPAPPASSASMPATITATANVLPPNANSSNPEAHPYPFSASDRPASEPKATSRPSPPRRAVSENAGRNTDLTTAVEGAGADDPLARAIMDTVDLHRRGAAVSAERGTQEQR